jgi:hypothetical protein
VGRAVLLRDRTPQGLGLLLLGKPVDLGGHVPVLLPGEPVRWARVVHRTRRFPGLWRIGLELVEEARLEARADAYLAA